VRAYDVDRSHTYRDTIPAGACTYPDTADAGIYPDTAGAGMYPDDTAYAGIYPDTAGAGTYPDGTACAGTYPDGPVGIGTYPDVAGIYPLNDAMLSAGYFLFLLSLFTARLTASLMR